jgi:two-component system, LytTR family, sensor kinase
MRRAAPYALGWSLLAAVYVAIATAGGASWAQALRMALALVLPLSLLGLLVVRLPGVLPWPEEGRARFFAAQAACAVAYVVLGVGAWIGLVLLDQHYIARTAPTGVNPFIVAWQAVICALLYLAMAGSAYAARNAQRVREESARSARADALRARAELAALRTQLNPHFLLNTLHTLLGLVRREPELAERALERLGELMYYGLRLHRQGVDQVSLREEWDFVTGYLDIERLRMGDRLLLDLDGDPEVMDCLVPPFALQPLVENAVLHGIAPRKEGGRLTVSARRQGDRLRLEVCDDGPGLPAAPRAEGGNGSGVGLQLLRERLAMLYTDRAGLRLDAAGGRGLRATLDLPLERWAAGA